MEIMTAEPGDVPAWLELAREVEPLFGPMVGEPGFLRALEQTIGRGTAFCVREGAGPASAPLLGGLLFAPRPPVYRIGWLAVAERARGRGIGRALVAHVVGLVAPPGELVVTTFGGDVPGGGAARRLYERMGFQAAEAAPDGPEGGSRQIFRRVFSVIARSMRA